MSDPTALIAVIAQAVEKFEAYLRIEFISEQREESRHIRDSFYHVTVRGPGGNCLYGSHGLKLDEVIAELALVMVVDLPEHGAFHELRNFLATLP
jgi:hypothetical protein